MDAFFTFLWSHRFSEEAVTRAVDWGPVPAVVKVNKNTQQRALSVLFAVVLSHLFCIIVRETKHKRDSERERETERVRGE